ncbi:uncharacterized protein [Spinacia oleracea]|uniref:Endonuclease/exonuclease/phosphatase domain-containing protein n=1 Tax=Spinacia oleracea TaxID=3562 RepID=A0A9R0HSU8_SPIOL|nr:uncharacterized protein LOC110775765 [Spinacia oleracea]
MNISTWNVRGLNDPIKVVEIKKFLASNNISVVALLETKVQEKNSCKIQKKIGVGWQWIMNYEHSPRGRIWIGWKHALVSVQLIQKTEFCVHCHVTTKNGLFDALFSAVYGLHSVDTRRPMWREITTFSSTVNCPWLVMGDFNAVLLAADRVNGNAVTEGETKDFDSCMDAAGLAELKSCGSYYSWSNKGQGNLRICSRIDRAIANALWHSKFVDAVVDYLPPGISDHSPLVMSCNIHMGGGSRPFKFFNYMADHVLFLDVVKKGWDVSCPRGGAMFKVWTKLKAVKQGLKELHHKDFAKLDERIEGLRADLGQIQIQLASCPTDSSVQ